MSLKNNKYLRRLAAALMSGVMMASMMGMTAFADQTGVTENSNGFASIALTKTISMLGTGRDGASAPDVTYTYTISAGSAVADTIIAGDMDLITNKDKKVEISSFPIENYVATGTENIMFATILEGDINVIDPSVGITKPGVYRYIITETSTLDSGIVDGTPKDLYLDLYIENVLNIDNTPNGKYKITGVVMRSSEDVNVKKDGFTANYTTYVLTLTKKLAGDAADLSAEFPFTITSTWTGNETAQYVVTDTDTLETNPDSLVWTPFSLKNGIPSQQLGHGDCIVVRGIPSNAGFEISETDAKGYTTTYKVDDASNATQGATMSIQSMNGHDHDVVFTNSKDAVTPTGVIVNIAPYVAMVVLAAGLAFLFLRRRKRDF